jgi:general secretion pathway protein J
MSTSERNGGFTLVELLVATTLLALLSLVLFGGLRFGARAWEAGGESIERTGEMEAAQELLRRTLVEAMAFEQGGAVRQPPLTGGPNRISFFAPMPRHEALAGPARYAIWVDPEGRLSLAWELRRPERKLDAPFAGEPATLLQNVEGLSLSYYGPAQAGEQPGWHESWSGHVLPLLIRIDVAFGATDRRRWPELVIAPRLAKAETE